MRSDFIQTASATNDEIFEWKIGTFEVAKFVPFVNTASNLLRIFGAVALVAFSIFQVLGGLCVGFGQWILRKPVITAWEYIDHGQWGITYNICIIVKSCFLGIPFVGNSPFWVWKCVDAHKARQQGSVSDLGLGKSSLDLGPNLSDMDKA